MNNALDSKQIQIFYNIQFPLKDILDILYPIFGQYYPFDDFLFMIYTIKHIFCAYDPSTKQPIACALLNNDSSSGGLYVMLFGVRESNQRHGIGTQLLQTIVQWARQRGFSYIQLHVNIENQKAMGLYEKVGFQKMQYVQNFYKNIPKSPPHAFRMILSLQ